MALLRHRGYIGDQRLLLPFLLLGEDAGEVPVEDVHFSCLL